MFPTFSPSAKALIKQAIEERLMVDPIGFSKPLHYKIGGYVSDYRIVYRIKYKTTTVVIVAIKHRKEVYEGN
ncbi:Uncharacterized protein NF27_EY01260 [Candidatus Jidaibacter acanthamoeba]|uniref:Type II toxin-antitoxin system RelE/ParE family toxin n=2 Tax=Candidatus Jidaibacter acanthamoebae TaxID=86105 RepID=A0A0C1QYF8_9RICK|nr:Uncharacterized protein NF27_EY01260 [Candidatus Jidaibacter acanthamoeba]